MSNPPKDGYLSRLKEFLKFEATVSYFADRTGRFRTTSTEPSAWRTIASEALPSKFGPRLFDHVILGRSSVSTRQSAPLNSTLCDGHESPIVALRDGVYLHFRPVL
jgi:hypothetical protein